MYIGYIFKIANLTKNIYNPIIFTFSMVLYLTISFINRGVNISIGIYNNYSLFMIAAMLGIITWINIAKYIDIKTKCIGNILTFIGQNSIIILGIHLSIQDIINIMVPEFMQKYLVFDIIFPAIRSIIITSLTLLMIIPFIFTINNKFKWILGK